MRGRPSAATDKWRGLGLPGKTCGFHSRKKRLSCPVGHGQGAGYSSLAVFTQGFITRRIGQLPCRMVKWVNVDSWDKPTSRRFIQAWPTQKLRQTGRFTGDQASLSCGRLVPTPSNPCRAGKMSSWQNFQPISNTAPARGGRCKPTIRPSETRAAPFPHTSRSTLPSGNRSLAGIGCV